MEIVVKILDPSPKFRKGTRSNTTRSNRKNRAIIVNGCIKNGTIFSSVRYVYPLAFIIQSNIFHKSGKNKSPDANL